MLKCPHCQSVLKAADLELENCPHCDSPFVISEDGSSFDFGKTIQSAPEEAGQSDEAATRFDPESDPGSADASDPTADTFISEVIEDEQTLQVENKVEATLDASGRTVIESDADKTFIDDSIHDEEASANAADTLVDSDDEDDMQSAKTLVSEEEEDSERTIMVDPAGKGGAAHDNDIAGTIMADDPDVTAAIDRSLEDDWSLSIAQDDPPTMSIRAREKIDLPPSSSLVIKPKSVQSTNVGPVGGNEAEYEIQSILGKGGMGVVYEARQTSIDRSVAVKMLGDKLRGGEQSRQKFLAEAVVTGELDHPNVVPIYDVGINDRGSLFYSMKKVQGTPWNKVIREKSRAENLEILMRVADAVAFAHSRGVVHRDLKPENIMLGDFGEVLVMDWGLAQPTPEFRKKNSIANVKSLGGTPSYMAPEMVVGPVEKIGPASDIYLLGAILYEILAGNAPHSASNVSQALVNAGKNVIQPLSEGSELADVAMKAMATKPEDRYADVRAFQQDIRNYQEHTESLALAALAEGNLKQALETGDYETFSRAMFSFDEAVTLWDGNKPAKEGASRARIEYARTALEKGDLDLAESLLDAENPDHAELRKQVVKQQTERQAHQRRLRTAKRLIGGLAATVLIVVTGALFWVMKAERQARLERDIAQKQRAIAVEQTKIAKEQEAIADTERDIAKQEKERAEAEKEKAEQQEALAEKRRVLAEEASEKEREAKLAAKESEKEAIEQRDIADKERNRAEEERIKAVKAREEAVAAKEAEEYEAYIARIGLAAAKIDENAFDTARVLLEACPPKYRQWEWGRLMYLCSQAEQSFDIKLPADCLALAPDNRSFVTGGGDGVARQWDAETGALLKEFQHGGPTVRAVAFSPDGRLLATGGDDPAGLLKVWDVASGQILKPTFGAAATENAFNRTHTAAITSLEFSHDSRRLLSASLDGTARLWDVESGRQIHRFFGHNWWVWSARFRREKNEQGEPIDEKRIVTAGQDGTVIVWSDESGDWTDDAQIRQGVPFRGHEGPVYTAIFSPNGRSVLSGGYDRRILIWDPEAVVQFDFLRLAEGLEVPKTEYRELKGHTDSVRTIEYSQQGALVVSGGRDNTVRVWDQESGKTIRTFRGHGSWVSGADFSRDGRWIISAGQDAQAKRWSLEGQAEILALQGRRLSGHTNAVLGASFSPDGDRVVTASQDRFAKSWSADSGSETRAFFEGHQFLSSTVMFLPSGRRLITSAMDNTARVWDLASGIQELQLDETGRSAAVAVSTDGRWIVTGSSTNAAKLWDAESGKLLRQFDGHAHEVTAVAITTANGQLALSCDDQGRCWLWGANTGEAVRSLGGKQGGHSGRIIAAAFTADGRRALTASLDHTVAQWDVDTGRELVEQTLKHPAPITAMAVSAGFVVTGCSDGLVRVWDIETAALVRTFIDEGGAGSVANNLRAAMEQRAWDVTELSEKSGVQESVIDELLAGDSKIQESNLSKLAETFQIDRRELIRSIPSSVSVSETGLAAVVFAADHKIRVWDLTGGRAVMKQDYPFLIWSAAFEPHSQHARLAVVGGNQTHLIDAQSGETKMSFGPHGAVASANYSPDGKRLVTGSWDNSARVWDAVNGRVIAKLEGGHNAAINTCVFSPDDEGQYVLTASDDGTAKLWEIVTEQRPTADEGTTVPIRVGRVVRTFVGHQARIGQAKFSPDGRWVLTASDDKTAAIWESGLGGNGKLAGERVEPVCVLNGHEWEILSIDMSADGSRVITGSADKTARIWELHKTEEGGLEAHSILRLEGHTAGVTCVAFSPLVDANGNGRWDQGEVNAVRALTASHDNTVKLWDTRVKPDPGQKQSQESAKEILTLTEHNRSVTTVAFSKDGRRILSASRDGRAIIWESVRWLASPEKTKPAT